jgi:hypothetical protein
MELDRDWEGMWIADWDSPESAIFEEEAWGILRLAGDEGLPVFRRGNRLWLTMLELPGIWDTWGLTGDSTALIRHDWLSVALMLARRRGLPVITMDRPGAQWLVLDGARYLVCVFITDPTSLITIVVSIISAREVRTYGGVLAWEVWVRTRWRGTV